MKRITYKISAVGQSESEARTAVSAGAHHFVIDEPVGRHGTDLGASPLEYLVGAFIGCTNVIAGRIAKDMNIRLVGMEIAADAELDGDVLQGLDTPQAFPELRLNVRAKSDATPAQIAELKIRLARSCPISVLFRQSGTKVIETWDIEAI